MARTASNMMDLGTKAPDFKLMDTITDHLISLDEIKGERGTLIMFVCNHCPFVKHVNEEIVRLANDYRELGFGSAAISSNDIVNYPQDSPERMKEVAAKHQYSFPYLFDGTQEVAKAYQAACTPDFYLFDGDLKLVYRGQMDDSRPGNGIHPSGRDLREAMDAILNNRPVSPQQKPSIGCNIKWKE
ncbi:thioredoxin family protein [Gramella sp. GC03-9]|uniref:Thioredoxin family protein n=1 Tax=Christiangramia oceanisediminis TaxID=2920386 RepID=A0A9X2KZT5_9FLAO|nr:thioredoxin family protein [Gramella oceanisediminis]MCP9201231.1 thioredoxin family protein [Gramella oceanisediminis]